MFCLFFFSRKVHYRVREMWFNIFVHWLCWNDIQLKCWGFMAFIQTKYRKKITDDNLRDNLPVVRWEFSIDILTQIAYMMCTNFFFSGKWKSVIYCLPYSQTHTFTQTTLLFSLHWTQQRIKYTFILKTLSLESLLLDMLIF